MVHHIEDFFFVFIAPYVKVYLLFGKKCVAKKKTKTARKTLDPLYSQQLEFPQNYRGKVLQVSVQSLMKLFRKLMPSLHLRPRRKHIRKNKV